MNDVEEKMLMNDESEQSEELKQRKIDSPWRSGEIEERKMVK